MSSQRRRAAREFGALAGEGFFFSSRRRHTRYIGDWSSDVCSSDLTDAAARALLALASEVPADRQPWRLRDLALSASRRAEAAGGRIRLAVVASTVDEQIGRAPCRERR